MIVEFHFVEIQAETIVGIYSVETKVEMIVEFSSLEMLVETIVDIQPWRCLCRDGVEYLHVQTPKEMVVNIKQ